MQTVAVPASEATASQIDAALRVYQSSFSRSERLDSAAIRDYLSQLGNQEKLVNHFWVIEQGYNVVGIAVFSYVKLRRLGYIRYMAVAEEYRSQGIGSEIFDKIVCQIRRDAREHSSCAPVGLCWEVERVDEEASNSDSAVKRVRFYERQGGRVLKVRNYVSPPAFGGGPKLPYWLMFLPLSGEILGLDESQITKDVVEGILIDVWQCVPNNQYAIRALRSISP